MAQRKSLLTGAGVLICGREIACRFALGGWVTHLPVCAILLVCVRLLLHQLFPKWRILGDAQQIF